MVLDVCSLPGPCSFGTVGTFNGMVVGIGGLDCPLDRARHNHAEGRPSESEERNRTKHWTGIV